MFYNYNVIYGAAVAGQQKPPRRRARSRSFSGADDSRSWEVAAAAAASAREDRGDVDADAPVHKSQLFAQNAIRRAPLVSIPTPPSLHPLVTQTSSDMIGAALKQELS